MALRDSDPQSSSDQEAFQFWRLFDLQKSNSAVTMQGCEVDLGQLQALYALAILSLFNIVWIR